MCQPLITPFIDGGINESFKNNDNEIGLLCLTMTNKTKHKMTEN